MREFKEFILRGNILDLAVAVIIAVAFTAVVTSLVENIITPFIAAIGGQPDFAALSFTINNAEFRYGEFLNSLFSFIVIAAVVFFLVIKPANALLRRHQTEPVPDPTVRKCPECLSDIPAAANRCAFCTAAVGPGTF